MRFWIPRFSDSFAFVVDGGYRIGTGHLYRCLSLAHELHRYIRRIVFFCPQGSATKRIVSPFFPAVEMRVRERWPLGALISQFHQRRVRGALADSYRLSARDFVQLRKACGYVAAVDDLAHHPFPVDRVINAMLYARRMRYPKSEPSPKLLLGPRYALLRREFLDASRPRPPQGLRRLLITMGGGDPNNLTPKILRLIPSALAREIWIIAGPLFKNIGEIRQAIRRTALPARLFQAPKNLARLFRGADLAITGGGTTLFELARTGTPALVIIQAENQRRHALAFCQSGAAQCLGEAGDSLWQSRLVMALRRIQKFPRRLSLMSRRGSRLVEGQGARRTARILWRDIKHGMDR